MHATLLVVILYITVLFLFFSIPRPPKSTRTHTRLPYPTLFLSHAGEMNACDREPRHFLVGQPVTQGNAIEWPAASALTFETLAVFRSDGDQLDRKSTRLNSSH